MPPFYSKERLTELLNKTVATTLTPQEAQLVLDLIKLFDSCEDLSHPRDCLCNVCTSVEHAGENQSATFDSLAKKCTERTTKPF